MAVRQGIALRRSDSLIENGLCGVRILLCLPNLRERMRSIFPIIIYVVKHVLPFVSQSCFKCIIINAAVAIIIIQARRIYSNTDYGDTLPIHRQLEQGRLVGWGRRRLSTGRAAGERAAQQAFETGDEFGVPGGAACGFR